MWKFILSALVLPPLTERRPVLEDRELAELAKRLDRTARRKLGRSLSIRQIDAGSCNGCELEIHALNNAFYDLERFGLRFVASPRHADVLMVTGPVTRNMREALERTYEVTPSPKWVVAVGDCAIDGGMFASSYAVVGAVSKVVPVDLHIRGCPPRPIQLLEGLLRLLEPDAKVRNARSNPANQVGVAYQLLLAMNLTALDDDIDAACAKERLGAVDRLRDNVDTAQNTIISAYHALRKVISDRDLDTVERPHSLKRWKPNHTVSALPGDLAVKQTVDVA